MANAHLNLDEIIWEITGKCNNGCKYCGSKEAWKDEIDEEKIRKIANFIALYPPKQIDISGGDPLLVSLDTHKYVTDILKKANITCKILINPLSLDCGDHFRKLILDLYQWIGVSVNTKNELEKTYQKVIGGMGSKIGNKITIITNFNLENIFLYDKIEELVKTQNVLWQVQYTMYKDDNGLALYSNEDALEHFFEKITNSISNGIKIVLADNLNTGKCSAGKNSLGILSNGDVIPCLSMRSWENIEDVVENNLFENLFELGKADVDNPLKYMWEKGFAKERFGDFKCCKDHCGNKCYKNLVKKEKPIQDIIKDLKVPPIDGWDKDKCLPLPWNPPIVLVYSVTPNHDGTFVYAVPGDFHDKGTAIYSVTVDDKTSDPNNTTVVTNNNSEENVTRVYSVRTSTDMGKVIKKITRTNDK